MNQKGFSQVILLGIIVVAILTGAGWFLLFPENKMHFSENEKTAQQEVFLPKEKTPAMLPGEQVKPTPSPAQFIQPQSSKTQPAPEASKTFPKSVSLFGQQCDGSGDFKLGTFPIDPGNLEFIMPMGRVQDSHVVPTNHQYVVPAGTTSGSFITDNPKKYSVKAPADGYIITIELFKQPVEEQYRNQPYQDNYLVFFEHSCDFYTRLIHIDTLSEKVLSLFKFIDPDSPHPYASTRIPVKQGEVIGTIGSHSFDFQIVNTRVKNPKILSPHNIENMSFYTVDTFDYITDSLKKELLSKNLTKNNPLGGRIGYDIDGKLIGNWFLVGRDKNRPDYWVNDLSVVYDHLDSTQIRVSFGNYSGYPKAFGVKGNIPDPAKVGQDSGIIKYELATFDYYSNGQRWDGIHFAENLTAENTDEMRGVALFQLIESRKLKVEVFPGRRAAEVSGFTGAARIYER